MGHVYEGEEWRHTDDAPRQLPTRAEMQRSANADYATGFISLGEWRKETDRLSNVDSKGNPLKCHR